MKKISGVVAIIGAFFFAISLSDVWLNEGCSLRFICSVISNLMIVAVGLHQLFTDKDGNIIIFSKVEIKEDV